MTRREFIIGGASLAAMGARQATADDSPELMAAKSWFREAQFGGGRG